MAAKRQELVTDFFKSIKYIHFSMVNSLNVLKTRFSRVLKCFCFFVSVTKEQFAASTKPILRELINRTPLVEIQCTAGQV